MMDFDYFRTMIPTEIICADLTAWFRWYLLIYKKLTMCNSNSISI